jgi:hypothetical protein
MMQGFSANGKEIYGSCAHLTTHANADARIILWGRRAGQQLVGANRNYMRMHFLNGDAVTAKMRSEVERQRFDHNARFVRVCTAI